MKRLLATLWLTVVMLALPLPLRSAPPPPKIDPRVWEAGGSAGCLVILREQADLSAAYRIPDRLARRRWVYARLLSVARRTQPPLIRLIAGDGMPVRSFYIVNALYLPRSTPALLRELARRPDVARIVASPEVATPLPRPSAAPHTPGAAAGIEPNIAFIGAPDVWALGYHGEGIVIGGQDTGYAWEHPALRMHYRGWDGSQAVHDGNWHDAIHSANADCPADSPQPCDDYGHGTHTMGIAVGDDGGTHRIGVAPAARWIGCRNMNDGVGSPATYLECFEFFLAPYAIGASPDDGDPALAPDITTNSWSCPPDEGCDADTLREAVEAERAAGIFTVVAAGNSGPQCASVADPPALYAAALTIGAVGRSDDTLASFSSRGPVTADGSGRLKPDLTAPGVSITSASPPDTYAVHSGTSMATPHVAGTVALLWSAAPYLQAHLTATTYVLTSTAVPITTTDCSSDGRPNNLYGWGRIDAYAAVTEAITARSTIRGQLCQPPSGEPLSATLVIAASPQNGDLWSTTTSAEGLFTLTVLAGPYTLTTPIGETSLEARPETTATISLGCALTRRVWLPLLLRER